ncbi:NYN domain-containing protein [Rhodomicrobium lacus]|uniref:NYN domain-containing protein n=1 Tax=Rhodomicrobium lacus TaxID=2498452 RepID=UPI0026E41B54|nr:NYN domain-containing protein [Rhodomicrobium lacus]WKW49637.1 NYN domain-containing protein [Rhodomicrobium lacus]
MIPGSAEVCLSALFVDFDNVYLSLRRQSEEAAGRFARNPAEWMARIATGGLVRFKSHSDYVRRRFAVARCYGNPGRKLVSRGGPHDPHNFADVRVNFMMAGLEVVDCQPLSNQFKNGTDIKIACDIRDFLEHPTRFGEFIVLSGDADFTPVLHHLRSHDRRTVVYANESTADIYKAFSDGWIEERDMISFLLGETAGDAPMIGQDRAPRLGYDGARQPGYEQSRSHTPPATLPAAHAPASSLPTVPQAGFNGHPSFQGYGAPAQAIPAPSPAYGAPAQAIPAPPAYGAPSQAIPAAPNYSGYNLPQEPAKRRLPSGHANSAVQSLIEDFQSIGAEILNLVLDVVQSSEKPVPIAYLADRAQKILGHAKTLGTNWAGSGGFLNFLNATLPDNFRLTDKPPHFVYDPTRHRIEERVDLASPQPAPQKLVDRQPAPQPQPQETGSSKLAELQTSITRIYDACKAPPLPPSEYQLLFTLIATEVHERGFAPVKTAQAVVERATREGLRVAMKDVSFVLDAVDEIDPWLEHTRSPAAVARAYRDFVLAKCHHAGVKLTEDEHQLVQVWFGASQWSAVGQTTINSSAGQQATPLTPVGVQRPAPNPRSYMADSALPPPDPRSDIPLPPDFGFDRELEPEQAPKQRFSFKH